MTKPESDSASSQKPALDFTRLIHAVHAYWNAKNTYDTRYDEVHSSVCCKCPTASWILLAWNKEEPELRQKLGEAERSIILEAGAITAYFDSQQGSDQSSQIGGPPCDVCRGAGVALNPTPEASSDEL